MPTIVSDSYFPSGTYWGIPSSPDLSRYQGLATPRLYESVDADIGQLLEQSLTNIDDTISDIASQNFDDNISIYGSNGKLIDTIPNGGFSRYIPDDTLVPNVPDGGFVRNIPDGSFVPNVPDGSFVRNIPDDVFFSGISDGELVSNAPFDNPLINATNTELALPIPSEELIPNVSQAIEFINEAPLTLELPVADHTISFPVTEPLEQVVETVAEAAQDVISQAPETLISGDLKAQIPTATQTTTSSKLIPGWLPAVAMFLYSSKEKHLRNVNVTIKANAQNKSYRISLKKNDTERSINFKVLAGKPIHFQEELGADRRSDTLPSPIFQTQSEYYLGPLNNFIWRRNEFHTDCNITINDTANPILKDGPKVYLIPLSEREAIRVVHQDPRISKLATAADILPSLEDDWATKQALEVDISDKSSCDQDFPLSAQNGANDEYLHIYLEAQKS